MGFFLFYYYNFLQMSKVQNMLNICGKRKKMKKASQTHIFQEIGKYLNLYSNKKENKIKENATKVQGNGISEIYKNSKTTNKSTILTKKT